jgi:hypothetical protein
MRLAVLGTFIAALPLSVDAPRDSTARHGQTRVEVMGGAGQYGIVTRGCQGEILSVVHRQLRSGALVVEHETADGVVLGVRGGQVRTKAEPQIVDYGYGSATTYPGWSLTNRYVNPFVAYESNVVGIGAGWLKADEDFEAGESNSIHPDFSAHLRFGDRTTTSFSVRWMEDVPLQSEGNFSMLLSFHPSKRFELEPGLGVAGPYDGALFGLKGRFWVTPEAAAQIRAGIGGQKQYHVLGGLSARWPAKR